MIEIMYTERDSFSRITYDRLSHPESGLDSTFCRSEVARMFGLDPVERPAILGVRVSLQPFKGSIRIKKNGEIWHSKHHRARRSSSWFIKLFFNRVPSTFYVQLILEEG